MRFEMGGVREAEIDPEHAPREGADASQDDEQDGFFQRFRSWVDRLKSMAKASVSFIIAECNHK
jgi:hypothetical protein